MEARLRICGDADASRASDITGNPERTTGCSATSRIRAIAPTCNVPSRSSMPDSGT
ncbi:hypothetical protein SGRIM128S_01026 [Streptomyces griseomycini]